MLDSIVIGGYFLLFWHPIQYQSDSSRHRPHASEQLFSSTCDLYYWQMQLFVWTPCWYAAVY